MSNIIDSLIYVLADKVYKNQFSFSKKDLTDGGVHFGGSFIYDYIDKRRLVDSLKKDLLISQLYKPIFVGLFMELVIGVGMAGERSPMVILKDSLKYTFKSILAHGGEMELIDFLPKNTSSAPTS